jgi:hypothetical protein
VLLDAGSIPAASTTCIRFRDAKGGKSVRHKKFTNNLTGFSAVGFFGLRSVTVIFPSVMRLFCRYYGWHPLMNVFL